MVAAVARLGSFKLTDDAFSDEHGDDDGELAPRDALAAPAKHPADALEDERAAKRPHLDGDLTADVAFSAGATTGAAAPARDQRQHSGGRSHAHHHRSATATQQSSAAATRDQGGGDGARWRGLRPLLGWARRGSSTSDGRFGAAAAAEGSGGQEAAVAELTATIFARVVERAEAESARGDLQAAAARAVMLGSGGGAARGVTLAAPVTPCPSLADSSVHGPLEAALQAEHLACDTAAKVRGGDATRLAPAAVANLDEQGIISMTSGQEVTGSREPPPTPARSRAGGDGAAPLAAPLPAARSQPPTPPATPHWAAAAPHQAPSAATGAGASSSGGDSASGTGSTPHGTPRRGAGWRGGVSGEQLRRAMNGLPSAPASVAEEEGEGEEDEQAATGGECLSPEQRCASDNGGGDAGAVITPSAAAQGGPPQLGRASNTPVRRQVATDIPIIPEDAAVEPSEDEVGEPDLSLGAHLPSLRLNAPGGSGSLAFEEAFGARTHTPLDEIALMRSSSRGSTPRGGAGAQEGGQFRGGGGSLFGGAASASRASSTCSSIDRPDPAELSSFTLAASNAATPGSCALAPLGAPALAAAGDGGSGDKSDSGSGRGNSNSNGNGGRSGSGSGSASGGGFKAPHRLSNSSRTGGGSFIIQQQQQQQQQPQQQHQQQLSAGTLSPFNDARVSSAAAARAPPERQAKQLSPPPTPIASVPSAPGPTALQPAASAGPGAYLPNAAVTELPASQRGACWDADAGADSPVAALSGEGKGSALRLPSLDAPPSLLGRDAAGAPRRRRAPFWACGCLSAPAVDGEQE